MTCRRSYRQMICTSHRERLRRLTLWNANARRYPNLSRRHNDVQCVSLQRRHALTHLLGAAAHRKLQHVGISATDAHNCDVRKMHNGRNIKKNLSAKCCWYRYGYPAWFHYPRNQCLQNADLVFPIFYTFFTSSSWQASLNRKP